MITPPQGWTVERAGETVILTAPGAAAAGVIHYDERLRPIAGVLDLIKAAPPPEGFAPERAPPIQRIVTCEGEYGALLHVEGRMYDRPAEIALGFVLLDDFYARVRGVVVDPDRFDAFRAAVADLLSGDAHLLGRVRRRRVQFTPPPGWSEHRGLFESRLRPPDAPADPRAIVVGPALPKVPGLGEAILAGVLAGADPADALRGPYVPVATAHGLHGKRWPLRSAASRTDVVILEDASFVYCVRLDAGVAAPASEDVLHAVVESILPIPRTAEAPPTALFGHWFE